MDKALLTTKDASSLIGCSQSTLRNYEAVGLLVPAVKVGNRRYYSSSQVTDFILDCCRGSIDELEQGQFFLSSAEVRNRLSISYEALEELDKQGVLVPCRRLPLSHKRLYYASDIEKFISRM